MNYPDEVAIQGKPPIREIKERAFFGILWRGGYYTFHQLASLFVKIILVRLLIPADFGLIAMALIVFTSLDILNKFALGEPFIRDNESDPKKAVNTLFYLNLIFLLTTSSLCFFSASYVTQFFRSGIPSSQSAINLIWIIRIFAAKLILSLVGNVPMAILTKKLKFKELYKGNIAGSLSYLIAAPILAFLGFGIWSIVLAQILEVITVTSVFFFYEPFVPSLNFSSQIAKKYLKFNSNIFIGSIVGIIITNGDDTIIGRLMGPIILGYYNIGQQFSMLARSLIIKNINEISFPVFAKVYNDRVTFQRVFFKTFRIINLLAIPFVGGSIILARNIVLSLFGEKWLPMVSVFYILSIATVLESSISPANPALKSLNKPHIIRNSHLMQLIAFAILVFPFAKTWGYLGVCWVMVILAIIPIFYFIPILGKDISDIYNKSLKILIKIFVCTLFMMAVVYFIKINIPDNKIFLILPVIAGIAVYFFPMSFLDNELKNDIREGWAMLRKKQ